MNNKLLKMCALVLCATTLLTGCDFKSNKVSKIKKNDEININEKKYQDVYYNIDYYRFKDNKSMLNEYNAQVKSAKDKSGGGIINYDKFEIVNEDNDSLEVYSSGKEMMNYGEFNQYYFYIKKDDEYVSIFFLEKEFDLEKVKSVVKSFREIAKKSSSLKDAFNDFSKGLNRREDGFDADGLKRIGCEEAISATNSQLITYTGVQGDVKKLDYETISLSDSKEQLLLVGKTADDKSIWTLDLGQIEKGSKINSYYNLSNIGDGIFYIGYNLIIEARDANTGKVIWISKQQVGSFTKLIAVDDKVFGFNDVESYIEYSVFDNKGEYIDLGNNNENTIIKKANYLIDVKNARLDGDKIIIDVYQKNQKIGYYEFNTNTYKVEFMK